MTAPRPLVWIVLLFLIAFGTMRHNLNAEWYGQNHDANGLWISTAVRNLSWYGSEIHYLPVTSANPRPVAEAEYYLHHPPLVVWVSFLGSKFLGEGPNQQPHEYAMRFVSMATTLISLSLFYVLARRLQGERIALMALALYTLTPMIGYYGRMPNHEPLALVFLYALFAIYTEWIRRYSVRQSLSILVLALLTMLTAWAGAFFLFALGVLTLGRGTNAHRRAFIGIGIVTALFTVAIPLVYAYFVPASLNELVNIFLFRVSNDKLGVDASFTLVEFITQNGIHMLTTMSFGLVVLGGLGLVHVFRTRPRGTSLIVVLLAGALLYMLMFRNAFYIHDFYKVYFMPSFALAGAVFVDFLWNGIALQWRRFTRPLVIGICFWSVVLSGAWIGFLHMATLEPLYGPVAEELPSLMTEEDEIVTNLPRQVMVEYYAYRTVIWDSSLEEALALNAPFYLDCLGEDLSAVANYPQRPFAQGQCTLVDLRGANS